MAPRIIAVADRIAVELIVPNHVGKISEINLVEARTERVVFGVADTRSTRFKCVIDTASNRKFLTKTLTVRFNGSTKRAGSLGGRARIMKGCGIEFEREPPINFGVSVEHWAGTGSSLRGQ